ncbi:Proteasome subunit beta type-4 [Hordeum vulgare]|nr:Proteasome subunit beta type-4 [Hordeum vulgare]
MAIPILRGEWREDMTFEEAVKLIEKCLLVLLYRDRSSINKFQIAKITTEGSTIYPPYALKTNWGFAAFEKPVQGCCRNMVGHELGNEANCAAETVSALVNLVLYDDASSL